MHSRRDARLLSVSVTAQKNILINWKRKAGRTYTPSGIALNNTLYHSSDDTPLSKMSSSDVERYKKQRLEEVALPGGDKQKPKDETKLKTTSKGTINRELAVLSHLFNKAIEWGWITAQSR